jgi:hypothetical protein
MIVALPCQRQHQLLTNNFAAAEKLEKSEKRNAPVLEIEKSRGFDFKYAHLFCCCVICMKGGNSMN